MPDWLLVVVVDRCCVGGDDGVVGRCCVGGDGGGVEQGVRSGLAEDGVEQGARRLTDSLAGGGWGINLLNLQILRVRGR